MNLILARTQFRIDGIFGELENAIGSVAFVTCEHAFDGPDGVFAKVPSGTYLCKRGFHKLDHMTEPFETFEVTGVPGHAGILFHWGNYGKDSDGCILLGERIMQLGFGAQMVTKSRDSFAKFMEFQKDVDQFTLTILKEQQDLDSAS